MRLWSLKESFVKVDGFGLSFPLVRVAFAVEGGERRAGGGGEQNREQAAAVVTWTPLRCWTKPDVPQVPHGASRGSTTRV